MEDLLLKLQDSSPATVAETLALLLPEDMQRLKDALNLLETPASPTKTESSSCVSYHVMMVVDGSDFELTLNREASTFDACVAIAARKNLRASQVKLLAAGQSQPVRMSKMMQFHSEMGECTEVLAIITVGYDFGQPKGPLATSCSDITFEHFPVSAYLSDGTHSSDTLESCDGQEVSWPLSCETSKPALSVLFSDHPVCGKILMRFLVHQRTYALGLGVALVDMDLETDPEYSEHFFGLYHGGYSDNVCMQARRTFTGQDGTKHTRTGGARLAILFDFEERSMQCYEGVQRFGHKHSWLPTEDLYPVVSFCRPGDRACISVSFC